MTIPSSPLHQHLAASLSAHDLLQARLIVAVSGGPDSLALFHALATLRRFNGQLVVAHIEHGLRSEAVNEAATVAQQAMRYGATFALARLTSLGASHANLQARARQARYHCLALLARAHQARAVLVAHTANDQAETLLQRLVRGAGPSGLAAMSPATPWAQWSGLTGSGALLLRPLLPLPRQATLTYCHHHDLPIQHDRSNRDPRFLRVRLREEIIPRLLQENPQLLRTLGQTAQICADESDFLAQHLAAVWPDLADSKPNMVELKRDVLLQQHRALQRAALRLAHQTLAPSQSLRFERLEQALDLIGTNRALKHQLGGGILLQRHGARLQLRRVVADEADEKSGTIEE